MSKVPGFFATIAVATLLSTAHPGMAQQPASTTWQDFIPLAADLDQASGEDRSIRLQHLATLFETDMANVTDSLERDTGGRVAAQAYIRALLAAGEDERLAEQLLHVLQGGDPDAAVDVALGTPVEQDGSTWFPLAEQAGFFAGALTRVLAEAPQRDAAIATISAELMIEPPAAGDDLANWLPREIANWKDKGVSRSAMSWFDKGFAAGSQ